MNVNIEFFDENLIENVITSLNYSIDKTLYFGYEEVLKEHRVRVERFLKNRCGVSSVEFCSIDRSDLIKIVDTIEKKLIREVNAGNELFIDLTGGESLPLVAFGVMAGRFRASTHLYHIKTNELCEYRMGEAPLLSERAQQRKIQLTLDDFISLYGGIINYRMHKETKELEGEEDKKDIVTVWKLSQKYSARWPFYSEVLRRLKPEPGTLDVKETEEKITDALKKKTQAGSRQEFERFLDECGKKGVLKGVSHENGMYEFSYKNQAVKNYFWDSGSILEMWTLMKVKELYPEGDCRVGVHIDWDGVIHSGGGQDVLNEIDVMVLDHNLPIFISCKNGKVDQMHFYELETVANRFGGKYAKKVMAVTKEISQGYLCRSEEMEIEIWKIV